MKKIFILLFVTFYLNTNAQYVSIPDANFAAYLQGIIPAAMNGNQLDTSSTLVTTITHSINVNSLNISNLYGVEFFKTLTYIDCSMNPPLTSLPTLPNTLKYLFCVGNFNLSTLPILPNSITYINCSHSSLTTLPPLPNSLDTLNCMANQLTSLPALPNSLIYLHCGDNSISSLPTLPNDLTYLDCSFCSLTSIPPLPNVLRYLNCYTNNISCFPHFPNSINYLLLDGNSYNCLPNYISAMSVANLATPLCGPSNIHGCPISAPEICVVTTDSISAFNYNIIQWDNTIYPNVDSFLVYRFDAISSSYLQIGSLNASSNEFIDTAFSIGGPNGGNPQYASWKYKLAIRDISGNIGQQSYYHQTMFVQESGANFSWNPYTIESGQGQINPVTGYLFLRDDNNSGNWHTLVTISSNSTTDPNYSNYPNGNWRIDALGFNCTSNLKKSRSNTTKQVPTSTSSNNYKQINIYPNPTNDQFLIDANTTEKINVDLYDINGGHIFRKSVNDKSGIDVSSLNGGVYTARIKTLDQIISKKLVIIRR